MAKHVKIDFPEGAALNWQMYRSRKQFPAVEIPHAFELPNGEIGDAGDYVAYVGGDYNVILASEMSDFQPITNTERAKT